MKLSFGRTIKLSLKNDIVSAKEGLLVRSGNL
jgi:hypothetical protein